MTVKKLDRNFFQRLLGLCVTRKPAKQDSWKFEDGKLTVDLQAMPELSPKGSAVRLEGGGLAEPVLLVHGDDGGFHAFRNRCTHGKRALDPVPGAGTVQCCSVGTSTFDYSGKLIEGPAKGPLTVYGVDKQGETLLITL